LLPQRIGKYEVVRKLGQGAMGEVFHARDPVLSRDVAVKRITAGLDEDEMVRKRFRREAEAAARLMHPNIVTVYELGLDGGQLFMAMELLDGVDLKHALAARPMTLDEKVGVVLQVCDGLAFAHSHDIVHRDLKPANIHVLPGGNVKILDFGLARLSGSEMTSTGMVMGTPHYMSPEQVRGQKADARSDVFALGCLFYELLAGRKPFDAESMHGVLYRILQEDPVPVREAAPGTPEALARAVEKALAKNPADRFASAGDMLVALRQARGAAAGRAEPLPERAPPSATPRPPARATGGEPATAPSRSSGPPRPADGSRRVLLLGLAAGLLAVAGGVWALRAYVLGGPIPSPAPSPAAAAEGGAFARRAIDSQVELARRRLDAGRFEDAVREAEQALKLDPQNAAARQLVQEAGAARKAIDDAAAAVRSAVAAGEREGIARAAFALMELDPAHPEVERAATSVAPAFRPQAEEARRLAREARRAADSSGAGGAASFAEAVRLDRQGERELQSGQAVAAARSFLQARLGYEQARRARLPRP
jgi:serine/threonine-protein kinase